MNKTLSFSTPIIFIIFNRPDTAEKVFQSIRQIRPQQLFIIADGPRDEIANEAELCKQTRDIVDLGVDWPCDVYKQYHEKNHGCQIAISQGLTWAFTHIEEAIILEDDCLPHPSFFSFATHLLQHYRHDMRIGTISGANFQFGKKRTKHSYYFSSYFHCWGWATWKRAWNYFDFEMKSWPEILNRHFIDDILLQPEPIRLWERLLQDSYDNKTNSWAQRFMYSLWTQNLLSIMPQVNLVSNIGFDERAVHTKKPNRLSNMTTEVMEFPIKHPPYIIRDTKSDYRSYENAYLG